MLIFTTARSPLISATLSSHALRMPLPPSKALWLRSSPMWKVTVRSPPRRPFKTTKLLQTDRTAKMSPTSPAGEPQKLAPVQVSCMSCSLRCQLTRISESEVRRVIMTGLPFAIDNSLLASLIHRGALESYKIVKASESAMTASAVITFTTGSAAKSFYDKYPNGLVVKVNSKRSVASLELGENVDVVSGVMRGYLDSGATRVVRAIGADEDWGMGALRKAAEGKGRKLESIADFSRGEVCHSKPSTCASLTDNPTESHHRISLH